MKKIISKENKVIGDLKKRFIKTGLKSQQRSNMSATEVSGNISLAYYRGLDESKKEIIKEVIYLLKNDFPKASQFIKDHYKK